jgi:hypothetical protein
MVRASSSASFCSSIFQRRTREPLLPPPSAVTVKVWARIAVASHGHPPGADRIDGEGRRVMVDPDADPSFVVGDVINAAGRGATKLRIDEVVDPDVPG